MLQYHSFEDYFMIRFHLISLISSQRVKSFTPNQTWPCASARALNPSRPNLKPERMICCIIGRTSTENCSSIPDPASASLPVITGHQQQRKPPAMLLLLLRNSCPSTVAYQLGSPTPAVIPGNHHASSSQACLNPQQSRQQRKNGDANPPCVTAPTRGHGTAVQCCAWAHARRVPPSRWDPHSSSPHHMGTKLGARKKGRENKSSPLCLSFDVHRLVYLLPEEQG